MVTPVQRESMLGVSTTSMAEVVAAQQAEFGNAVFPPKQPGAQATVGGLQCAWAEDDGSPWGGRRWTILALPSVVADPGTVAALAEPVCDWDYDTRVCRMGVSVGDFWFLAAAAPMGEAEQAPVETLTALVDAASGNAASERTTVPAARTPERWPIVACAELGERMHLTEVLGEGYWSGRSEGSRQPEDDLYEHAGVRQFCQFGPDESVSGKIGLVTMTTAPGGAWIWSSEDDAVGEAVSVAGAEQARRIVGPGAIRDRDTVRATDGTNLIDVWAVGEGVTAPDIVERAIAALRQD